MARQPLKHCYKCDITKSLNAFYRNAGRKDGHAIWCKTCMSAYGKEYVSKHKKQQVIKTRRGHINRRKILTEIKTNFGCKHCGETNGPVLIFHHVDPATKKLNIGASATIGNKWEQILKEVQKCVVLCSNCHILVHWRDRNGIPTFEEQAAVYEATLASI